MHRKIFLPRGIGLPKAFVFRIQIWLAKGANFFCMIDMHMMVLVCKITWNDTLIIQEEVQMEPLDKYCFFYQTKGIFCLIF